jgi:hypothetical protein
MRLTGQAETLRAMLDRKDGAWMIGQSSDIQDGLKAIEETLRNRKGAMFV